MTSVAWIFIGLSVYCLGRANEPAQNQKKWYATWILSLSIGIMLKAIN